MIKKLSKNIEGGVSAVMLVVMLALLSMQVFLRFIGRSNSWSEEVSRYLFIWIVYLGAAMAAQTGSHICIEIIVRIWPRALRPYVQLLGTVAWILLNLVIVWLGAKFAYGMLVAKTISLGLHLNMAIPYAAVPVGFAFMTVRVILNQLLPQLRALGQGRKGAGEAP